MDQKPNDQLMFVLVHKKMLHGEIYEKKNKQTFVKWNQEEDRQ